MKTKYLLLFFSIITNSIFSQQTVNYIMTGGIQNTASQDESKKILDEALAALTNISGEVRGTITIQGEIIIEDDFTFPENVVLNFFNGGTLKLNVGVNINIEGSVKAGFFQIFTGSGYVKKISKNKVLYPHWWHNESTIAWSQSIQKTIDVVKEMSSGHIYLPKENYLVDDLLRINSCNNLIFELSKGATISTNKHGHGILEINDSENIKIKGGVFKGRGEFPDKNMTLNYIHPDNYCDINLRGTKLNEGGGEKRFVENAFAKPSSPYIRPWGKYRNGTNTTLIPYNGGYIGDSGIGILIKNGCTDIKIENTEVHSFNYTGIQVQFLGDPENEQKKLCKNITITNNKLHHNYSAGISIHGIDGAIITNNTIYSNGHPDAIESDREINPGYGITLRGVSILETEARNVIFSNNIIYDCKRRGVDAHSGYQFSIINNEINNCMVSGILLTGNRGVIRKKDAIISENIINNCGTASGSVCDSKMGIGSSVYDNTKINSNTIVDSGYSEGIFLGGNQIICDSNHIIYNEITNNPNTSGIRTRDPEGVNNFKISGNIISGDLTRVFTLEDANKGILNNNLIAVSSNAEFLVRNNTLSKDIQIFDNYWNNIFFKNDYENEIEEISFLIEYRTTDRPLITILDGDSSLIDSYVSGGVGEVIIFREGTKDNTSEPIKQIITNISYIDKKASNYIALVPGSTGNKLTCAISPKNLANETIWGQDGSINGMKVILNVKLIIN